MVSFWILVACTCAICLVPIVLECRQPGFELVSARNIFILYAFLQFVASPIYVRLGSYTLLGNLPIKFLSSNFPAAVRGQLYVAIGLLAFQISYSMWRRRTAARGRQPVTSLLRAHPHRLVVAALLLVAIAIASFFHLADSQGGAVSFLVNVEDFRNTALAGTGPEYQGMSAAYFAFVLVFSVYVKERRYGILSLLLFALSIVIGLAGAYRHLAVETVLTAAVMWHYGIKRLTLSWKVFAIIAVFIFANLAYVFLRDTRADLQAIEGQFQNYPVADSLYYGMFARFNGPEAMSRIVDVTDGTGYTGGPFLVLNMATFWVPRALWTDKPAAMTSESNILFFPESFQFIDQTGAAAPTVEGVFYWIAGPVGLAIGMALLALLFASADQFILRHKDLLGFALYSSLFIFAAFVPETLDLHVGQLVIRTLLWGALLLLCAQKVLLISSSNGSRGNSR